MVSRNIGIVICRVGAVLLAVQAIQGIAFTIETFQQSALEVPGFFKTAAMVSVAPIVGAIVLWFFAGQICATGTGSDDAVDDLSVDKADIVAAGTYLVGIYVLVFAIVDAVQVAALSLYPRLNAETAGLVDNVPNPSGFSRQAANVAQFFLGIALILIGRRSR